ncbi:hypothetical protein DSM101010T_04770 [Desulfovibrio subterraneus]|uniref:Uncharacterized protein n=1 Tax=Desulfovibrio subterraneus TaxID=2718620 RepID=A0A7J0BFY7_9BACT|nr:hypothetical protein DSM101010T_04770 [Desulfovibrio subterraneus]
MARKKVKFFKRYKKLFLDDLNLKLVIKIRRLAGIKCLESNVVQKIIPEIVFDVS